MKQVHVEIYESSLVHLKHHVHENLSIFKTLRDHGIPVDGVLELRGVTNGQLTMHNTIKAGERVYVFDWAEGPDTPAVIRQPINLDDV